MLFKGPADIAVEEVHVVLRNIVASTINSEDCKNLQQYAALKREIVNTASSALGRCVWRMRAVVVLEVLQIWHPDSSALLYVSLSCGMGGCILYIKPSSMVSTGFCCDVSTWARDAALC